MVVCYIVYSFFSFFELSVAVYSRGFFGLVVLGGLWFFVIYGTLVLRVIIEHVVRMLGFE